MNTGLLLLFKLSVEIFTGSVNNRIIYIEIAAKIIDDLLSGAKDQVLAFFPKAVLLCLTFSLRGKSTVAKIDGLSAVVGPHFDLS